MKLTRQKTQFSISDEHEFRTQLNIYSEMHNMIFFYIHNKWFPEVNNKFISNTIGRRMYKQ